MAIRRSEIGSDTVAVQGYGELLKALKSMDKVTRKAARKVLKEVGAVVSVEAQNLARAERLVDSGKLVRMITPRVLTRAVNVVASATNKSARYPEGYNYPKVYEFGGATHRAGPMSAGQSGLSAVRNRSRIATSRGLGAGATATTGSRAFMAPALANKSDAVAAKFEEVLTALEREWTR